MRVDQLLGHLQGRLGDCLSRRACRSVPVQPGCRTTPTAARRARWLIASSGPLVSRHDAKAPETVITERVAGLVVTCCHHRRQRSPSSPRHPTSSPPHLVTPPRHHPTSSPKPARPGRGNGQRTRCSGRTPTPISSAGSFWNAAGNRRRVRVHAAVHRPPAPAPGRAAGSPAARPAFLSWETLVGAGLSPAPRVLSVRDRMPGASIRAVATASCTARLMPTPPIGDMACAASPISSTPGAYQRRSRSTRTLSVLTSSQSVISPTRSASGGACCATESRNRGRPSSCTVPADPLPITQATCQ